jgi:hypothetical protein
MSKTHIFLGIDDTDNLDSRGTGWLARQIAVDLKADFQLIGVTRHQLLVDSRIPYTSHNSSAALELQISTSTDLDQLFERVRHILLGGYQIGSDPGLCLAGESQASQLSVFGQRAKREVVTQTEARQLASHYGVRLVGLGGTEDGVIGALAAVGLSASGVDGRYLLVGRSRDIFGPQPVSELLASGIDEVRTLDGDLITEGIVLVDKLRPSRRNSRAVLYVEQNEGFWLPLKLD